MVDIHRFLAKLFCFGCCYGCFLVVFYCYYASIKKCLLNALNMIIHYRFHQILKVNVLVVQLAIFY